MNTSIKIERLTMQARHGVMPQELSVGNEFSVSLRVDYPFGNAMDSDNLDDTLNYAELCEVIKKEMQTPSQLLEHVAGRIIRAITSRFPLVESGEITITKITPPIPMQIDGVSVTVTWHKNEL